MTPFIVAADRGDGDVGGAEHFAAELAEGCLGGLGPPVVVCTHQIRTGQPHYAVSLAYPAAGVVTLGHETPQPSIALSTGLALGVSTWAAGALQALTAHRDRSSGRAVQFPGSALLTGELGLDEVLDRTGIEDVQLLGGGSSDGLRLQTRGHVRPTYLAGRLVLLVRPAQDGVVIPFEIADPHVCCAVHSARGAATV